MIEILIGAVVCCSLLWYVLNLILDVLSQYKGDSVIRHSKSTDTCPLCSGDLHLKREKYFFFECIECKNRFTTTESDTFSIKEYEKQDDSEFFDSLEKKGGQNE